MTEKEIKNLLNTLDLIKEREKAAKDCYKVIDFIHEWRSNEPIDVRIGYGDSLPSITFDRKWLMCMLTNYANSCENWCKEAELMIANL